MLMNHRCNLHISLSLSRDYNIFLSSHVLILLPNVVPCVLQFPTSLAKV
jgi:hypothetical protein